MTAKLFGQLAGLSASGYQFDHLRALLGQIGGGLLGVAVVTHLDSFLT